VSKTRPDYNELKDQFKKIAEIAESMAACLDRTPSDDVDDCVIMDAIWSVRNLAGDLKAIHRRVMTGEVEDE
jgi:hypothetical protein